MLRQLDVVRFGCVAALGFICTGCGLTGQFGQISPSGARGPGGSSEKIGVTEEASKDAASNSRKNYLVKARYTIQLDDAQPLSSGSGDRASLQRVSLDSKKPAPRVDTNKLPAPALPITPEVKRELQNYMGPERGAIEQALNRKALIQPELERIFAEEGIPAELLNLPVVESCFNSAAKSPAGAFGMWQFMKSTAQTYGLRVEKASDQRGDPILSTVAAARHLRDLYLMFNDWYLALAAYNAGAGLISRTLVQNGAEDFWSLARAGVLNGETKRFVPKFIAAALIMNNPKLFGFNPVA